MKETPMEIGADDFNRRVLGSVDFQALNNEVETILNRSADEDNGHKDMREALEDLARAAELVLGDITDQDTGWYYQLLGRIQDARKAIAKAKGGQS